MSATTITTAPTATAPKRAFKRRYTVAQGNAIQAAGITAGSSLLAAAAALDGPGLLRTGLMLAGFIAVYLNCHSIAHYAAGRLVGLRFRRLRRSRHRPPRGLPARHLPADAGRSVRRHPVDQGQPRAGRPARPGRLLRRRRNLHRGLRNRMRGRGGRR